MAMADRPEAWRDWAGGLPDEVLEKMAAKVVAQTEAGWAAQLKEDGWTEEGIQENMAKRKSDGNCLFVFARVCKGWRKAQLKVGSPLRTRVWSDVILPGRVALAKWALAEGCPRERHSTVPQWRDTMAHVAAQYGHVELVKWLCVRRSSSSPTWPHLRLRVMTAVSPPNEGSFAMDERVMRRAAGSGNLQLVQWLRANGCPWDAGTCWVAVQKGHVEVLRWARENGCPWRVQDRDEAAEKLGYTDDLGNLIDYDGNPI